MASCLRCAICPCNWVSDEPAAHSDRRTCSRRWWRWCSFQRRLTSWGSLCRSKAKQKKKEIGKITTRLSDMTQLKLHLVHFRDDTSPVISCSACTLWSCWKWGARLWQTPSDFHSSLHTASLTLYSGPSGCQWCPDSPEHNKVDRKKSLTWFLLLLFYLWHTFFYIVTSHVKSLPVSVDLTGYSNRSTGCLNGSESGEVIIRRTSSRHWPLHAFTFKTTPRFWEFWFPPC